VKYQAFISYSHAADGKLAEALQHGLTRFAKRWHRIRGMRLFRDTTNLSVRPDLWQAIQAALGQSEYFILLASPEAAQSKWVRREIDGWVAQRGNADRILLVLTHGDLQWDEDSLDIDWQRTTAIPPILSRSFSQEPLHLDLRWAKDELQLSTKNPKFQNALAELAATILDRDKDELIGEEVRQHRLVRRLTGGAIAGLTVLALAATVAGFVARKNAVAAKRNAATAQRNAAAADSNAAASARNAATAARNAATAARNAVAADSNAAVAEHNAEIAENRGRIALSRQLAAESRNQVDESLDRALLLAVEATSVASTIEAQGSLLMALEKSPFTPTFLRLSRSGETQLRRRVWKAAFHTPSRQLITTNFTGWLELYDFSTGRPIPTRLQRQGGVISGITFAPDGSFLATSEMSGQTRLHDLQSGRYLDVALGPSTKRIIDIDFNPADASLVVGREDGSIEIVPPGGKGQRSPPLLSGVSLSKVAVSPDGRYMAVGGRNGSLLLWDMRRRDEKPRSFEGLTETVSEIAFDRRGEMMAAGDQRGTIALWRTALGEQSRRTLGGQHDFVTALAFSPDGHSLVSGGMDKRVVLWDLDDSRTPSKLLPGHAESVTALSFSDNGRQILSVGLEGTLVTWDTEAARPSLRGNAKVLAVAFDSDGRSLQSLDVAGKLVRWDLATLKPAEEKSMTRTTAGVFGANARLLAYSTGDDRAVRLLDSKTKTNRELGTVNTPVTSIAVSPDGMRLAVTMIELNLNDQKRPKSSGSLLIYPVSGLNSQRKPTQVLGPAFIDVAVWPDGRTVAAGQDNGKITLWDTSTGKEVGEPLSGLDGWVGTIAISDDGKLLAAVATDARAIHIWDVSDRVHPKSLGQLADPSGVSALAFSPSGKVLAAGANVGSLALWDVATLKRIGLPLTGHKGLVSSLAFSRDGRKLASAGEDSTIILWDVSPESWRTRACRIANRTLTPEEAAQYLGEERPRNSCGPLLNKAKTQLSGDTSNANTLTRLPEAQGGVKSAVIPLEDALKALLQPNDKSATGHWRGFSPYRHARSLCAQRVVGTQGELLDWASFASADAPVDVAAFYESNHEGTVKKRGSSVAFLLGDRVVLSIPRAGDRYPS
jgi:WD40 repeat protein